MIVQDYGARKVARPVRVEALLQARVQSQELPGDDVGRQAGKFRNVQLEFHQEVRGAARRCVRLVGNDQGCRAQALHFLQHLALRFITALGEEEGDQGFRSHDGLGPVAKFQGVEALAVRARHLHHFQHTLVGDPEERSLAQIDVVREGVGSHKLLDAPRQFLHPRRHLGGQAAQACGEFLLLGLLGGQGLEPQQHGGKGARHDGALLVRRQLVNRQSGNLLQFLVVRTTDGQGPDVALRFQQFRNPQGLRGVSGSRYHDRLAGAALTEHEVRKEQQFRRRHCPRGLSGQGSPGSRRPQRHVIARTAADEYPIGGRSPALAHLLQLSVRIECLKAICPTARLRKNLTARVGSAG